MNLNLKQHPSLIVEDYARECGWDSALDLMNAEEAEGTVSAICTSCGYEEPDAVEPDAEGYECPSCDEPTFSSIIVLYGLI